MTPHSIPRTPGVYRIVCTVNSKMYIGSTVNLRKRRYEHFQDLRNNDHHSITLQRAWNKYGEDAFTFEILEFVLVPEALTAREQYWFGKFKPFGSKGFNIARVAGSTLGLPSPNRGRKMTPEQLERHRLARIGKKPSEEARRNMSKARKGKTHSSEARAKISQALRGRKISSEQRAKLLAASIGRVPSEEARANMRRGQANRPSASIETRKRMSASIRTAKVSHMKRLIVTSPNGDEYSIQGIRMFCEQHQLDHSALKRVADGKQSNHKGWKARYPDDTLSA